MNAESANPASQLRAEWQDKLQTSQNLVCNSPQFRAQRQSHIRLYDFLLSAYGEGTWQRDDESQTSAETGSMAPRELTTEGKPAKSPGQFQRTLKHVHAAIDDWPTPGPFVFGLHCSDWITVASESGHISPRKAYRLLKSRDIEVRAATVADDVLVLVRCGQRHEAMALIREHRAQLHARRPLFRTDPLGAIALLIERLLIARIAELLVLVGLFVIGTLGILSRPDASSPAQFLLLFSAAYVAGWIIFLIEKMTRRKR